MKLIRHYLKAVSALLVQLFAMGLTWYLTGSYSEAELVQTLTAILSALLVAATTNGPAPEPPRDPNARV